MVHELLQIINDADKLIEHQSKLNKQFETKLNDVFVELLEIQRKLLETNIKHEDNSQWRETEI